MLQQRYFRWLIAINAVIVITIFLLGLVWLSRRNQRPVVPSFIGAVSPEAVAVHQTNTSIVDDFEQGHEQVELAETDKSVSEPLDTSGDPLLFNPTMFIIDIRSTAEFRSGHLSGAVNIPVSVLTEGVYDFPKDRQIVFYSEDVVDVNVIKSAAARVGVIDVTVIASPYSAWAGDFSSTQGDPYTEGELD